MCSHICESSVNMAQQGACVRCGAANVNGWLQEGQSFCCEKCWTCLLCGSLRKKALWPAQPHRFPSCRRCEEKSKQLSSEAKDLLLAIDALQFDFVIWSTVNGRPMKLKDPPFAQPAEAGEGLLIGDFSDVQAACLQARRAGRNRFSNLGGLPRLSQWRTCAWCSIGKSLNSLCLNTLGLN